jgi:putative membrane protein
VRPDPYSWSLHVDAVAGVAVLVGAYAWALRRHPAPRWRLACFAAGATLLLAIAVTPLHALSFHLLAAHLLQNVVLAEWAPLLVVLGIPPALGAALARSAPGLRRLVHPLVALPLWLATYYLWHLPPAYDTALAHPGTLLHLEHLSYFVTGALMWWCVLQPEPWRLANGQKAAYLFAAFVLGAPLGLLLALLPDAVYGWYEGGFEPWGLGALTDQQLAGMTMAAEQSVVFFVAFLVFFVRFLADEERPEAEADAPA